MNKNINFVWYIIWINIYCREGEYFLVFIDVEEYIKMVYSDYGGIDDVKSNYFCI